MSVYMLAHMCEGGKKGRRERETLTDYKKSPACPESQVTSHPAEEGGEKVVRARGREESRAGVALARGGRPPDKNVCRSTSWTLSPLLPALTGTQEGRRGETPGTLKGGRKECAGGVPGDEEYSCAPARSTWDKGSLF